jgi:putative endopeptidase
MSVVAQQQPLTELPYSPSLDPTSMDVRVNPCQDFYRYTCGNWNKKNPMPADEASWDVYSKLHFDNQRLLWGLLEEAAKPTAGRTPAEQKIGDYYHSCMDEAAIEQAGMKPIKPDLDEIAAISNTSELERFLVRQHGQRGDGDLVFGFSSGQDFENSQSVIAFAGRGALGLPDRDYYTKTDKKSVEIRDRYVEHIQRMFELAGEPAVQAKAEATRVMAIETALAQSMLTRVELRTPRNLLHKMNRAQLTALAPSLAWPDLFATLKLTDTRVINVTEPAFFKTLEKEIHSRPIGDWKDFLRWHVILRSAPYLSSQFARANFDFYGHTLRGIPEMQPRWKRCVQWVDRDLGEALGQVFVARTFAPDTKQRTEEMTREIERAMEDDLKTLAWMSEATRQQAMTKLHAIVNKIGYPEKWRDYSSLEIAREDFEGNVERATRFENRRQLAKIGRPLDRKEWSMTPPTVNAYFDPQMNDINFPAGVLQPPLYDAKLDDAPNYGNTGATIGHELTHGFDDEGRQFDAQGNLRDWWTPADAKAFEERTKCVADQYAQYTVIDDIKINSKLTLGEDVADLGGTLLAYIAWKHATAAQKLESAGGFTPDQRFFIGMAQWACGDIRPEMKRVHAVTDPHSPLEYRVNGVVSNMPEFSTAFGCKAGDPMVRAKACRVW